MDCMVEECRNMDKEFLDRHEEKCILEKIVNKVVYVKCKKFLLESPSSSNKRRAGDCNNLSQTGTMRLKRKILKRKETYASRSVLDLLELRSSSLPPSDVLLPLLEGPAGDELQVGGALGDLMLASTWVLIGNASAFFSSFLAFFSLFRFSDALRFSVSSPSLKRLLWTLLLPFPLSFA